MKKRYLNHSCKKKVYHINLQNNLIYEKYTINLSTYVPIIIINMIKSIKSIYDNHYIICPFYNQYYDYQIGITETSKIDETSYDTIVRGVNEECGLDNIIWNADNLFSHNSNKYWFGVNVFSNNMTYNPQSITCDKNDDDTKKVAIIIHNKIDYLLNLFQNINQNDIQSDNISGIGLISVYDCKQIINRFQ